jgi:hypothetical protein
MRCVHLPAPTLLACVLAGLASSPLGCAKRARIGEPLPTAVQPSATATELSATELARQISHRVEAIRGLEFKKPVKVETVSAAEAREHFRDRTEKLWPESRCRLEQAVYVDLGLLPPDTDLRGALLDLLEEQVWGYYDPETDTFFVLDDVPPSSAPILMAHELTHALDDQYFEIDSRFEQLVDDDDASTAFGAVVEGSGTAVMTVFMSEEMRAKRMSPDVLDEITKTEAGRADKLKNAPALLRRGLLGPYTLGLAFLLRGDLEALRQGIRVADLNQAFERPPVSTEQVLHPEKYWAENGRDVPVPVPLDDQAEALGPGWRLAGQGHLGELNLALLAGADGPHIGTSPAGGFEGWTVPAAEGIAGDVYHHYTNGPRHLTLVATLWDSAAEAAEFAAALDGRRVFESGAAVILLAGDVDERAQRLGGRLVEALGETGATTAGSLP